LVHLVEHRRPSSFLGHLVEGPFPYPLEEVLSCHLVGQEEEAFHQVLPLEVVSSYLVRPMVEAEVLIPYLEEVFLNQTEEEANLSLKEEVEVLYQEEEELIHQEEV
jgi:hypothetical protein